MSVSITVQDLRVVFSSISRNEEHIQKPASLTCERAVAPPQIARMAAEHATNDQVVCIKELCNESERLAEADVVASFMPSTPETRGLANAEFFAAMKPGALFANGGRGDLVVADDLVAALESGHLAGAAVDVTDPEPLPATSPLWDAPNMLITPHVSGWFHLEATLNNVVDIAAENLRHLQAGETLRCWIEH